MYIISTYLRNQKLWMWIYQYVYRKSTKKNEFKSRQPSIYTYLYTWLYIQPDHEKNMINRVLTNRRGLVQCLSWVFTTQKRKKEKMRLEMVARMEITILNCYHRFISKCYFEKKLNWQFSVPISILMTISDLIFPGPGCNHHHNHNNHICTSSLLWISLRLCWRPEAQ